MFDRTRVRLHEAVRVTAEIGQDVDTETPEDTMSATVTTLETPLMRSAAAATSRTAPPRKERPAPRASSSTASASTRLTRRGRLAVFVAALVALSGLTLGFGSQVIATDEPGRPVPSRMVTVAPGDTLWDIARRANPDGDLRTTVHEITELNALASSGEISAGQEIAIPLY